jgi:adenylate kinase
MTNVIAVFGISGVGKTWLASRLAAQRGLLHVQAGELLRQAKAIVDGQATTAEELRTGPVLDNQTLLVRAFEEVRSGKERDIVFDGHSLIDTEAGLVEVPVEIIEGLRPAGIVFVRAAPQDIARRRSADLSRRRPQRSVEQLAQHQELALSVCCRYHTALALPIFVVASGDMDAFHNAVCSILTGREL